MERTPKEKFDDLKKASKNLELSINNQISDFESKNKLACLLLIKNNRIDIGISVDIEELERVSIN